MEQLVLPGMEDFVKDKPKEKPSKNAFYLAKSGMQKSIRRRIKKAALMCAEIVWTHSPWDAFRRLVTIVFEDCGRDHELVKWLFNFREHGLTYKELDDILLFTDKCVESAKSRDVSYLSGAFRNHMAKNNFRRPLLEKECPELVEAYDIGFSPLEYMEVLVEEDDYAVALKDWIFNVLHTKVDREKQSYSYLWYYVKDKGQVIATRKNETTSTQLLNQYLPQCTLDGHTMYGKMAISALWNNHPELKEKGWDKKWLSWMCFECDSALLNNMVAEPENFGNMVLDTSPTKIDKRKTFKKLFSEYKELQQWAVKKKAQPVIDEIKDFCG